MCGSAEGFAHGLLARITVLRVSTLSNLSVPVGIQSLHNPGATVKSMLIAIVLILNSMTATSQKPSRVGGYCEVCEGMYEGMPKEFSSETRIAPPGEPGEPMEIRGIIYKEDGKVPAPGIILYVYHTDARGYYSPGKGQTGMARRHGHLRGWVKSNSRGEYKFISIRPAPYPERNIPAHIHPIIKEPDKNEYFIDEYVFDDDPLVTDKDRGRRDPRGGSGILKLTKDKDGVWRATRDIILGLNVPNYR